MDRLLHSYQQPKLTHKATENPNKPIIETEMEIVMKTLPVKKYPSPDGCIAEFYKAFLMKLTQILYKLFKTIRGEASLPNSFYEATIP